MYEKGKQYVNFKFQLDTGIAVEHACSVPKTLHNFLGQ